MKPYTVQTSKGFEQAVSQWCRAVRPSKVASYSGCDSRRERASHPPVASLGAKLATAWFKRRQARERAESES